MPRTKHTLRQKQYQEKKIEEKRLKQEEEERQTRKEARMEREKKAEQWDRRYRPQVGDQVLYVERGYKGRKSYQERYVGPVTYSKWDRSGQVDFEIRLEDYSNHRDKTCTGAHGRVREEKLGEQFLFFTEKELLSSKVHSVCYTDCFVRHLRKDEDYEEMVMKTYFVARTNLVFPEKRCKYGERCNNKKVGHSINFWH